MDFKDLRVSEVGTLKLKHPVTGEIIEGAEVDVLGRDSKAFRQMVYEEAQTAALSDKPGQSDERNLERCARLVVAIRGIEENGIPIIDPRQLFDGYPWALEQIQAFILTRRNFMRPV